MHARHQKTTPGVKNGRVRNKNNRSQAQNYYNSPQRFPVIDRKRPGRGYRHVLSCGDVRDFLAILPAWRELSAGLNAVVLASGEEDTAGYHVPGVVHVCAWERDLWQYVTRSFYEDHQALLARLGVPCEWSEAEDAVVCRFTMETVRAYQLLHVLLHELGHHHDRMTTRLKVQTARGESYAEAFAHRHEALVWARFQQVFGPLPGS